jgi:hypothetical protein
VIFRNKVLNLMGDGSGGGVIRFFSDFDDFFLDAFLDLDLDGFGTSSSSLPSLESKEIAARQDTR